MLYDCSHTITSDMPVYPGDDASGIKTVCTVKEHGYWVSRLETGIHVGTHIDAPGHMIEGGKNLSEIPLDHFVGKGIVVDARAEAKKGIITPQSLAGVDLKKDAIVLVCTGWGEKFRQKDYYVDHPVFHEDFAQALIASQIKIVGMDTPSPDGPPFDLHRSFLSQEILIIENLCKLENLIPLKAFEVLAWPLKTSCEGSPVRVVAQTSE